MFGRIAITNIHRLSSNEALLHWPDTASLAPKITKLQNNVMHIISAFVRKKR
jgi:hypothetical protein